MAETEIARRLEKLERDNRRLKGFAIAALVLAAAFGAVYATQSVPQKITAHEFDVLDSSGKVGISVRGRMINVFDAESGLPRLQIGNVWPTVVGIWLFEGHGSRTVELFPKAAESSDISLFDTHGKPRMRMGLLSGEPNIRLNDTRGFEMELGSMQTLAPATGTTEKTSAASIIMFGNDKDHHAIWQAP